MMCQLKRFVSVAFNAASADLLDTSKLTPLVTFPQVSAPVMVPTGSRYVEMTIMLFVAACVKMVRTPATRLDCPAVAKLVDVEVSPCSGVPKPLVAVILPSA